MENSHKKYNIGIEIGGTNIKVAVVDCTIKIQEIIETILNKSILVKEFKTVHNPEDTIREISEWLIKENQISSQVINKVCISMFGPLNLGKKSEDYGTVLNTPKPGWKGFNVVKSFAEYLNISKENIIIELDVNCAAYLEYKLGNHKYVFLKLLNYK
jgi:predicted NBD/HSP70 family sugar kinase